MSTRVRSALHAVTMRWRRIASRVAHRGRAPTVCERVDEWAARVQGTESRVLYPPRRVTRSLPHTIEAEIHREYLDRQRADQRGRYLVTIRDARIVGRNGLVLLPDGSYAAESVYGRTRLEQDPEYFAPKRRPRVVKAGNYFSLIVYWSRAGNYYHWFHDTLPRLFGVMEFLPLDTVYIVPPDLTPLQRESLRLVGIEDHQLVPYDGREVWELETLSFAPPIANAGSSRGDALRWLRDEIVAAYGIELTAANRRVFVSRRDARRRRLTNEAAVEAVLHEAGFETQVTGALTLREQVELFSETEMVISTHGAAFTNMLFSPPGLTIVEMIEPGMITQAYIYWTMAEELGHEYWYFIADSVPLPGKMNDTAVPLPKLRETLDRIERQRAENADGEGPLRT